MNCSLRPLLPRASTFGARTATPDRSIAPSTECSFRNRRSLGFTDPTFRRTITGNGTPETRTAVLR